ncbi:hypothetical protein FGIG_08648 [Fasciola gigantica]|uniref:Uncharacterized protein n=1 Tax=Fasciola gigantica TaxID=46835 RepID=A0A504YU85_FASGI|nr:hypothetical protein FGIG_08648 [Fasciola gigantica]
MHQFCPQVKAGVIRGLTEERCQDIREHEPMWLSQALFTTPLSVLCTTEQLRSLPRPSPELGDSSDARTVHLLDPFSLPDQDHLPLVHFPYPRLVLGLLQGLEVAWASPLAPRISISDAVTFLTRQDGAFAQGVFPVVGASELCIFHARKLAVDYCQRRVDCRTDLFRFTKQLLMSLFVICHGQDCASLSRMRSEQKLADTREQGVTCYLPHLPLDRLLYCLNPREMSILLSDVRRNLRLRLAFEWLRNDRLPGVSHPLAVIATKTMDALGGGPVPPAPAFITPGLLLALLQSHLIEPGVANLVGPLFTAVRLLQSAADTAGSVESTGVTGAIDGDADSVVEEIDVNGELVVVLND